MQIPPNILVIIADSARADAYENGSGGEMDWIETPVTDQLSRDGMTFTRAFTPVGLCHPARACLDSGMHNHANGQLINTAWDKFNLTGLLPNAPSYLRLLQSVGYRIGCCSQRHLRQSVFDDVVPGAITGLRAAGLRESLRGDCPSRPPWFGTLEQPTTQHKDAFTARGAQELLRRYAAQDKPWLVQVEFDGPHPPFYLPQEFATRYDPKSFPKPASLDDDGSGKPITHRRARAQQLPEPWGDNWRQTLAHYGGYVTMLDQFTGEILGELDRLGMANDTVVIVTSDHGELVGAHGCVTKYAQMYDEVLRVPLRVRWPGHIAPGQADDRFISHIDLLPTIAELAGAPCPETVHGKSWASVAQGSEDAPARTAVYGQLHGWGGAWYSVRWVRDEGWKYVYSPFADDELYDLKTDPHEITNVAAKRPEQVAAMRSILAREMQAVNDPLANAADFRLYL